MDDILAPIQDLFEGQIDFQGQKAAEILSTALLVVSGVCATIVGYIYQNIYLTLWIGLAGTFVTALVVVPPWPIYNKSPEKWLPAARRTAGAGVMVDRVKVS